MKQKNYFTAKTKTAIINGKICILRKVFRWSAGNPVLVNAWVDFITGDVVKYVKVKLRYVSNLDDMEPTNNRIIGNLNETKPTITPRTRATIKRRVLIKDFRNN